MPIATPLPPSQHIHLPPPQTFDILPPLHALLSRLLLPYNPSDPFTPSPDTLPPITPKDLGGAATTITSKIQKARAAVQELPGGEMSLEEQEGVIRKLEAELKRLERVKEGIRGMARDVMEGHGDGGVGGHEEGQRKGEGDAMVES